MKAKRDNEKREVTETREGTGREEIIKRFSYYQNPKEVQQMYDKMIKSTSLHHRHRVENYKHNWDHRFFWGYVANIDSLQYELTKGDYFYCIYKQDYNFFIYALYQMGKAGKLFNIYQMDGRMEGKLFNTIAEVENEIINKVPN